MSASSAYALTYNFNQDHYALRDLTNTLEQKVLDRTLQLEESNKQKTKAFINISYEIKTPVTLINNYLNKHIEDCGATKELEIAQQNTNKLKRDMINVLDFENQENNELILKRVMKDIAALIKNNINNDESISFFVKSSLETTYIDIAMYFYHKTEKSGLSMQDM